MNLDWVLKPCCARCYSTSDLYWINCKHTTLCLECGKGMAENCGRCHQCGAYITKLIQEYNVQAMANTDVDFFIGRFASGSPPFSKNSAENRWSLYKGLQERQLTDILRNKNKTWILKDETGQHQFRGQVEGPQSSTATHYLLMVHGRNCFAVPNDSRYNFSKIAQCKQLTLEEAEEKMNKRRHNATGHEWWMMKMATSGAAAFREVKKNEGISKAEADEGSRVKKWKRDDKGDHSDKGDEDEEEWEARKNRFAINKMGVDDDEEEGGKGGDFYLDDDGIEKGDDWEHEETFTDDDEAVGNDPWEREELDPKFPAPPEIKQDEEDEDEENGGLSKSGKEIKKLLAKAAELNEFKGEEEEDEDDDKIGMSHELAQKHKDAPKDEPAETTPAKAAHPPVSGCSIPAALKSSKAKRKHCSNDKNSNKYLRVKMENTIVKAEAVMNSYKPSVSTKPPSTTATPCSTSPSTAAITEEEIRAAVVAGAPVEPLDLVAKFKSRLKTPEEKHAFVGTLRRISKSLKVDDHKYIVIKDR